MGYVEMEGTPGQQPGVVDRVGGWLAAHRPLDWGLAAASIAVFIYVAALPDLHVQCGSGITDAQEALWQQQSSLMGLGGFLVLGAGAAALACRRSWWARIALFLLAVPIGAIVLFASSVHPCAFY
jgi:hypothetical protein